MHDQTSAEIKDGHFAWSKRSGGASCSACSAFIPPSKTIIAFVFSETFAYSYGTQSDPTVTTSYLIFWNNTIYQNNLYQL